VREAHEVDGIPDGTPLAFRYDLLDNEARLEHFPDKKTRPLIASLIAEDLQLVALARR